MPACRSSAPTTELGARRERRSVARLFPRDGVTDANRPARDHLRERTAAPLAVHRVAKSGHRFFHALARLRLTRDLEPSAADAKDSLAGVGEANAADHEIRAPRGWWRRGSGFSHERVPHFSLDEGHL